MIAHDHLGPPQSIQPATAVLTTMGCQHPPRCAKATDNRPRTAAIGIPDGRCRRRDPLLRRQHARTRRAARSHPPRRADHHAGGGGVTRRKRRSPEFAAWLAIQSRGRVCRRWASFGQFYADVGKRPTWQCLLIRDNPTAEFSPTNARWRIAKSYRWRRPRGGAERAPTTVETAL
jgi:hypothetical protein